MKTTVEMKEVEVKESLPAAAVVATEELFRVTHVPHSNELDATKARDRGELLARSQT